MKQGFQLNIRIIILFIIGTFSTGAQGFASENQRDFSAWLAGVKHEAAERGISAVTIEQSLTNLELLPKVVKLDQRQPEYSQVFSYYLSRAVTAERIKDGQNMMRRYSKLLAQLERQYGVPSRFLVALWGLETNYGRLKGNFSVISSLASLSFEGRRESLFRRELFDALAILDRGDIKFNSMKGSWAGAMGHMQFMPSTYLDYAVDQDGDGRIDLFNSVPDALGSAGNYLREIGWKIGYNWGREVRLPRDFDIDLASVSASAKENKMALREWANLGVMRADGVVLPHSDITAALVLPEGSEGAAFLVYDNYNVILDWNYSVFYALSIGHLADRLIGLSDLVAQPRNEQPLSRPEIIGLQSNLINLGYLEGKADGILGSKTRKAIKKFQRSNSLIADGYADRAIILAVTKSLQK
ncbi:MAG: lytic transglycosylase [Candidatus Marinimicrobia bacterium]|nr:lytic transglycosylase [Candidatus Neomarinimicrobiota bacterium]